MRQIFHLPIRKLPERGIVTTSLKQDKYSIEGLDVTTSYLKDPKLYKNGWFRIYIGKYNNKEFFVSNHPIGSSGVEILLEEAYAAGARKILRIGSCYGLIATTGDIVIPEEVILGNVGVASAQGYSKGSVLRFNGDLIDQIKKKFSELKVNTYSGKIVSDDYFDSYKTEQESWLKEKLLALEMECSEFAIFNNRHSDVKVAAILICDGCVKNVKIGIDRSKERLKAIKNYRLAVKVGFEVL